MECMLCHDTGAYIVRKMEYAVMKDCELCKDKKNIEKTKNKPKQNKGLTSTTSKLLDKGDTLCKKKA